MNSEQFAEVFEQVMQSSRDVLLKKAGEYATDDDRLHNFNVAAVLGDIEPAQALGGMMVKHTTSIYDMLKAGDPSQFSLAMWDEKIGDHINYLILLKAAVVEAHAESIRSQGELPLDYVGTQPA
jgi:hypothetical protein